VLQKPDKLTCYLHRPSIGSGNQVAGIESRQTILLACRTRTMKLSSSDAGSEGQSGNSLEKWRKDRAEECVGRAQWKINQPPSLRDNEQA
jgi:hypothetical protein